MVCDKCGFEHNSRSVCPKCGARVVYVNEDYLRRRQEWEEAQKKGSKDVLPPGIMHSTREEHKAAKGRAEKEPETSTGGPETVSLSFRVKKYLNIKTAGIFFRSLWEKVLCLKDRIAAWYKKHFVKRRGADNPVIRDLKFDDSPDTLDESGLVLSHKVYKDYRKYYFIGIGASVLIAAGIIITVNIVKNIDRSNVFYFDGKFAYLADEPDEPLFGSLQGDISIICNDSSGCLAYDSSDIYLFLNGKVTAYQVNNPDIITYNESFDTVIYAEEGRTYLLHNGTAQKLEMPENAAYTDACIVSRSGKYFALTVCENNETYYLYLGDLSGELCLVWQGSMAIGLDNLSDEGVISYVEMSTAEYGIVNQRNIMQYDDKIKCLAENVSQYEWTCDFDGVYYTTDEDKLYYAAESSAKEFVDEEVTSFVTNISDNGIYYYKNGKCYGLDNVMPYYVCDMSREGCGLIYEPAMDIKYYYDRTTLYAVDDGTETCYPLISDESFVFRERTLTMYVLNSDGELICIKDDKKNTIQTIAEKVSYITEIQGMDGIAYICGNELYAVDSSTDKKIMIFETNIMSKIVFSQKQYYLTDKNNILWSVDSKGKNAQSLGNVQIYNLVD